jgi:hypothetical protein
VTHDDAEEYTQALGQVVAGSWRQVALGRRLGVPQALGLSVEAWVQDRLGGYARLSIPERREAVKELTSPVADGGEGLSARAAADVLGVGKDTVRREMTGGANAPQARANPMESLLPGGANAPRPEPLDPESALDEDGLDRIDHGRLRHQFSRAWSAATEVMLMDPEKVAGVLDSGRQQDVAHVARRLRAWLDQLDTAMDRGLRVVGREEGAR